MDINIPSFRGYEILEMLPRGGMSAVYKARQLSLDRIVAIKVLPPALSAGKADVEKFMAEARITAGLKHANIVQVYDFGKTEDDIYYFVMEYISGYSIAAWIHRKKYLSEENSLLCALSVAAAMNYAWEKAAIVHCDIKPDNVIIDGDGTVKVADLGLARSVKSILGPSGSDEELIVGTPNYISPEQARGAEALDCRADIYSLGAMLYHCMTGSMPFAGLPPLEVMDRQITGQIPDPQDINPRISVCSACLIEKMMAKERDYRQKDWKAATLDFSNARSEKMPQGILPENVRSTVRRSPLRDERLQEVFQLLEKKPAKTDSVFQSCGKWPRPGQALPIHCWRKTITLTAAAAALVLVFGWSLARLALDKTGPHAALKKVEMIASPPPARQPVVAPAGPPATSESELRAQAKYEKTLVWLRANPGNLKEAMARLHRLAEETRGTKYGELARQEALRLERVLKEAGAVMVKLDKEAAALARQNGFLEAARLYEKYHGPFEKETAGERRRKAQNLQAKQGNFIRQQQRLNELAEMQLTHAADEIAIIMVEDSPGAAAGRIKDISADLPAVAAKPEFKSMAAMLEKSLGAENQILDHFRAQKGREIDVEFSQGPQKLVVRDVRGDQVIADKVETFDHGKVTISMPKIFRVRDLALSEKIGRVGQGDDPESALMHTVLALQDYNYKIAGETSAKTGPLLSGALAAAIAQHAQDIAEWRAIQAIGYILAKAGLYSGGKMPDPQACLSALHGGRPTARRNSTFKKSVSQFRSRFGATDAAQRYAGVLEALTNGNVLGREGPDQCWPLPQTGAKAKPGNLQMQAVIRKMTEQNPGLRDDQMVFQTDASGRITRFEIIFMSLKDISPLENLVNLQKLVCAGMRQNTWPEMPVTAPLADLMPLRRMDLRELAVNHTRVRDLTILSPMPLVVLNLANTRVNDLHPLKKMPLQWLDISSTPVQDIRPLAELPLVYLNISNTEVADLNPLRELPIRELEAAFTRVTNLTPLRSMRLKRLVLRNTEISDIRGLKGLLLEYLDLADTGVRDLSVLRDMPLRELDLRNTRVRDLGPLEQVPLEIVKISGCGVRDVSPLKNTPLKVLDLRATGVIDLTPLEKSAIEEIWLDDFYFQADSDKARAIMASLQNMPRLKTVNGKTFGALPKKDEP